jgi:hypothetical protein
VNLLALRDEDVLVEVSAAATWLRLGEHTGECGCEYCEYSKRLRQQGSPRGNVGFSEIRDRRERGSLPYRGGGGGG